MMRNIGIPRVAKKMAERLTPKDRKLYEYIFIIFYSLEAYSSGVNDYIDSLSWYPIEFYILQAPHPEPWTPEDSVGI